MDKAKVYTKLGRICFLVWMIIIAIAAFFIFQSEGFGDELPILSFFISLGISIAANFFYNPLLLIGAIFLWRARRNQNPPRKGWIDFIIFYLILETFLITGAFIAINIFNKRRKEAFPRIEQQKEIQALITPSLKLKE